MPNGRTFITQHDSEGNAGSPEVPTGYELNTGPAPLRIMHRFQANDQGIIGNDVNYFPGVQGDLFIPHQAIIRSPRVGASRDGIPTVDDTAYIPAFAVGDPR
jgi:hypothetical protein